MRPILVKARPLVLFPALAPPVGLHLPLRASDRTVRDRLRDETFNDGDDLLPCAAVRRGGEQAVNVRQRVPDTWFTESAGRRVTVGASGPRRFCRDGQGGE